MKADVDANGKGRLGLQKEKGPGVYQRVAPGQGAEGRALSGGGVCGKRAPGDPLGEGGARRAPPPRTGRPEPGEGKLRADGAPSAGHGGEKGGAAPAPRRGIIGRREEKEIPVPKQGTGAFLHSLNYGRGGRTWRKPLQDFYMIHRPLFTDIQRHPKRREPRKHWIFQRFRGFANGGEGEIRTLETLMRPTRFPVVRARPTTRLLQVGSTIQKRYELVPKKWWAFRDLNPGPSGYEPDALTS